LPAGFAVDPSRIIASLLSLMPSLVTTSSSWRTDRRQLRERHRSSLGSDQPGMLQRQHVVKRSISVVLREPPERRLRVLALMLVIVLAVGTTGYVVIEDWPVVDALYMTVITITTVGFGEIYPLSRSGRIFTIGLIAVGLTGIWYALSVLVGFMIEGIFSQEWERRRMEQQLSGIKDHFIVCGYGRVGRQIAAQLRRYHRPVVVIDRDPTALAEAASDGLLTVQGDATEDDILRQAGIARARGLITAVATDADNVFVTLSARALRPDLSIVARANVEDAAPKLQRAGATHVVSHTPSLGGRWPA
jgi:voltage-gated potassium channel